MLGALSFAKNKSMVLEMALYGESHGVFIVVSPIGGTILVVKIVVIGAKLLSHLCRRI